MTRPPDHPQRVALNDEVHARPPEALAAPLRLSYLALFCTGTARDRVWEAVGALAERHGVPPPAREAAHFSRDLGPFRLVCERHTEFVRFLFLRAGADPDPFGATALDELPADWLAALPGELLVGTHAALVGVDDEETLALDSIANRFFGAHTLVGASIGSGAGIALTDFRIHQDGFGRLLVLDRTMSRRQAGRMIQRLLEIDTYRVMALLALPVARELLPFLARCDAELTEITAALIQAEKAAEPVLLERLTRLAAEIESRQSVNLYRFSAASAYYDLVRQRIGELREQRILGLQTFGEFTERRLAPAMATCRSAPERQASLALRVGRATNLLSTRVNVTLERQNQTLLETMNRRAQVQLRLQAAVEQLSVAAVTYYVVGLVGHAAEGLEALGVHVDPSVAMLVSIPIVAALFAFGIRRIRRMAERRP